MPRVSLCSYTYNDAALLHGLLASVPAWSVRPDEIILLDDGSSEPFILTESEQALPMPVKLLRHEINLGFTRAKHNCISAASGDCIIALDCDARVTDDFLEGCLAVLRNKSVGMVGGTASSPPTDDYTSWYAYAFSFGAEKAEGDDAKAVKCEKTPEKALCAVTAETLETSFICGYTFALRREVWQEVGGFSNFNKALLEDSYLSDAIRARGYTLQTLQKPIKLMRVLTRAALCRRYWKWGLGYGWLDSVITAGQSLPQALGHFLNSMQSRCRSIEENRLTPIFYYYEMLILLHTLLEFCNALGPQGHLPPTAGQDLLSAVQKHLVPYPRLWMLLKSDLLQARALPLQPSVAPAASNRAALATQCDWQPMLVFFNYFQAGQILHYLEKEGVPLILRDDREVTPDFSVY